MIEVRNLTHDYEGKGNPSVRDMSFTIQEGTIFGFLGPSGAGKSTTQALMTGLLRIQQGDVLYSGKAIQKQSQDFYNQIGMSFEHPNVYGKLTGLENLKYFAGLFSVPTEQPKRLLDMVGLTDAANRRASAYSKGMKQRLVFARALVNRPRILFLDEPTSGLDPATAEKVKQIIREKRDEGCTVFLTTHNMQIADDLCDTVAFINDGEIVAMDAPRNLKLQYGQRSVAVEYAAEPGGGTGGSVPLNTGGSVPRGTKDHPSSRPEERDPMAADPSRADGAPHTSESGTHKEFTTQGSRVTREILFPERPEDAQRLTELITSGKVETMHSQEASLEQIFIKLTGRGLA